MSLHIDGIANARQISKMAEVDLEMVRACLRVLKHHGMIALVDMFSYSNRYECTEKVADTKLLREAAEFVFKRRSAVGKSLSFPGASSNSGNGSPELRSSSPRSGQGHDLPLINMHSSSFPTELTFKDGYRRMSVGVSSYQDMPASSLLKREDYMDIESAIAEFFCDCQGSMPIGELWISLVSKQSLSNSSSRIDWKKSFRLIDHRRLITFGLVHGLIRRIHNFPLLHIDITGEVLAKEDHPPLSLFPPTTSDRVRPWSQHHVTSGQREERRKVVNQVARLMDGMHCDDELVCETELPLDAIFALFPEESITSVFAT